MTQEIMRRRALIGSVITASIVEAVLLGWSLFEIGIGGIEGGGKVFVTVHVPSSVLFAALFSLLLDTGASMAMQVLFAIVVVLGQMLLFAVVFYWVLTSIERIKLKR